MFKVLLFVSLLVFVPGCSASQYVASSAGAVATGVVGAVVDHIDHVSVDVDPATGHVTGSLVFKDGRWVVQPPENRSVERCVDAAPARSVSAPAIDYRALVGYGHETRGISTRAISRGVSRAANDLREEEEERHRAEKSRLNTIIRATSQTTWGRFRRAMVGSACSLPLAQDSVPLASPAAVATFPIPEPAGQASPVAPPDALPESGTMKGLSNLEARVSALEAAQKTVDVKLDAILAAVKK